MTGKQFHILVAESDGADRTAMERLVETKGLPYQLEFTATVSAALSRLHTKNFDAFLLPYHLFKDTNPNMQAQADHTPCIVLTGTVEQATEALKNGAHDFLVKDHHSEYLRLLPPIIRRELRQRQTREELAAYRSQLEAMVTARTTELQYANAALKSEMAERAQAETALSKSESLLRTIAQNIPNSYLSIISKDLTVGFTAGQEFSKQGLEPDQFVGLTLQQVFGKHTETVKAHYLKTFAGQEQSFELFIHDQYQLYRTVPLRDEHGRIRQILAVAENITKRKNLEKSLVAERDKFDFILQELPIGVTVLDPEDRYIYINPISMVLDGYKSDPDSLLGQHVTSNHPAQARAKIDQILSNFKSGEMSWYSRQAKRGKRTIEISYHALRDRSGGYRGTVRMVTDITERQQATEKLRGVNRALRVLSECNQVVVRATNETAMQQQICEILVKMGGYRFVWVGFAEQDDAKTVRPMAQAGFEDGYLQTLNLTWANTKRGRSPGGTVIRSGKSALIRNIQTNPDFAPWRAEALRRGYYSAIALPLVTRDQTLGALTVYSAETDAFNAEEVRLLEELAGDLAFGIVALRTRAQREQAESALRVRNHIASILLTTPDEEMYGAVLPVILETLKSEYGVFGYINDKGDLVCPSLTREIWDQCQIPDKSIVFPHATWNSLWGRSLIEKKPMVANHGPFNVPQGHLPITRALNVPILYQDEVIGNLLVGNKKTDYTEQDQRLLEAIADYISPVLHARLQRDKEENERHRLETQNLQMQKMEAVNQLTAGIAHDFNNMLTPINGYAELIQLRTTKGDPVYESAGKIMRSGEHAADLIRQLMAFSRQQIIRPQVVDLNDVLSETINILRRVIGENIELSAVYTPDLWLVKVDPTQIEQVIINLAVNARDAMPTGGKLDIRVTNTVLDDEFVARHLDTQPGEHVLLKILDSGAGMSQEVLAHIFEPFYTTKERGKGTGLGLATTYGIIKQSGGYIRCTSREGAGTTFEIYLPRARQESTTPALGETGGDWLQGNETVLVVEDEPGVRNLVVYSLRRQGYTVLEAANGHDALHLAQTYPEKIHLMLTDVVMPGMNGNVLAGKLKESHPNLKIMFMSGYTDSTISDHGILEPGTDFIQKPFSPHNLARQVRKILR